jgi:transcriptional regulator with XRE-family HTH domain
MTSHLGAALLHDARVRAGLSRRTLADRAGVAITTVSRIEQGVTDPTIGMLERLLLAAGSRLQAAAVADAASTPTIAELATAVDVGGPEARVDWTRLRGFVDFVVQHPDRIDVALDAPPARTGTVLDQILAGLAEQLADEHRARRPKWTRNVGAHHEGWAQLGTPRMLEAARRSTPEPFARRNLVLARSALFHEAAR